MNNNDDETTKNNIVVNSQTKKSIKIYKKLTIKQAQKIDALKRRKQIVQTTKQTNTFVGKLKEDIHSIYNNAQKHQKIVKKSKIKSKFTPRQLWPKNDFNGTQESQKRGIGKSSH